MCNCSPRKEEKDNRAQAIFKNIIADDFSDLVKDIKPHT